MRIRTVTTSLGFTCDQLLPALLTKMSIPPNADAAASATCAAPSSAGKVAHCRVSASAVLPDLVRHRRSSLRVAPVDHRYALSGERRGDARTDPGTTSGDERSLAIQVEIHDRGPPFTFHCPKSLRPRRWWLHAVVPSPLFSETGRPPQELLAAAAYGELR
ncbi:hypothetical protein GGC64_006080 [Mycobacterium sp. OAS707]|nr:hypothetical protein [Mycobacterium sp. OAS707]